MAYPLPREHGAWGLLLQPFFAGAILTRQWTWLFLPALGLVLSGFLLREPLTILARQRWVWRTPNPQSGAALRWLAAEALIAAVCLAILLTALPPVPMAALTAAAIALTGLAVWLTIRNRQRSIALQIVSAAGLGTTALLAVLAAAGCLAPWAWQLWAVLSAHGAVSILTVHTRLRLKAGRPAKPNYLGPLAPLVFALFQPTLTIPLAFSAIANLWELARLTRAETLQEPLRRVGFRALFFSIAHSLLAVAALWSATGSPSPRL